VRSRVGPADTFNIRLEADVITRKRIHSEIHICFRERGVDHQQRVYRWCSGDSDSEEEGLKGEITANLVRNGVGESDILEATSRDLEVVRRITPSTNTVKSGVRKKRRVIEVLGI